MSGLLDLLIELEEAGVCWLYRTPGAIAVAFDARLGLQAKLTVRLRLAVEARREGLEAL